MDRFDIPTTMQAFIKTAISTGVLDPVDVFALGASHRDDWPAFRDDVMEIAFVNRHSVEGWAAHAAMCGANDAAAACE